MEKARPKTATVRFERPEQWMDRIRAYTIEINGGSVGEVSIATPLDVELMPGIYQVRARLDWCVSEPFEMRVTAGQNAAYEVRNPWSATLALYAITLGARKYLQIAPKHQDS